MPNFYFSDLMIHLEGSNRLHGHRFVLAARSDYWGVDDLSKVSELDFTGTCTAYVTQESFYNTFPLQIA